MQYATGLKLATIARQYAYNEWAKKVDRFSKVCYSCT